MGAYVPEEGLLADGKGTVSQRLRVSRFKAAGRHSLKNGHGRPDTLLRTPLRVPNVRCFSHGHWFFVFLDVIYGIDTCLLIPFAFIMISPHHPNQPPLVLPIFLYLSCLYTHCVIPLHQICDTMICVTYSDKLALIADA